MRACLETVRSSLLASEGGIPVATIDLALEVLGTPEACGAYWGGRVKISNLGSDAVDGFTVRASVEAVDLPASYFEVPIPSGSSQEVQLPEVLLLTPSSQWTFHVEPSSGNTDLYPSNNHAEFVLVNQGSDRWTMTFNADAFSNESSWRVQDALGQTLWSRDQFPPGPDTTIDSACIPTGCHTLTVEDSTGDGIVYGGSFTLVNAVETPLPILRQRMPTLGTSSPLTCVPTIPQAPPSRMSLSTAHARATWMKMVSSKLPICFSFWPLLAKHVRLDQALIADSMASASRGMCAMRSWKPSSVMTTSFSRRIPRFSSRM